MSDVCSGNHCRSDPVQVQSTSRHPRELWILLCAKVNVELLLSIKDWPQVRRLGVQSVPKYPSDNRSFQRMKASQCQTKRARNLTFPTARQLGPLCANLASLSLSLSWASAHMHHTKARETLIDQQKVMRVIKWRIAGWAEVVLISG